MTSLKIHNDKPSTHDEQQYERHANSCWMRVNISYPSRMFPMLICLPITKFYGWWSWKRKGDRGRFLSCNVLRKPMWLITRSEDIKTRLTRMMSWRVVFCGEWKHFRSKNRVRRKVSRLINTSRLNPNSDTKRREKNYLSFGLISKANRRLKKNHELKTYRDQRAMMKWSWYVINFGALHDLFSFTSRFGFFFWWNPQRFKRETKKKKFNKFVTLIKVKLSC